MNTQEFAQKIRQKYPGSYDHVDDYTLTNKVVEKYPVYKERITDFGMGTPTPLKDRLSQQNKETLSSLSTGREQLVDVGKGFVKGAMQTASGLTDVLGSIKSGVKDYAIELGGAMKGATPEQIQEYKQSIKGTETTPVQPIVAKQRELSKTHNTAQNIGSMIEQGVEFAVPSAAGAKLVKTLGLGGKTAMATQAGVDFAGGYGLGKLHDLDNTEALISGGLNAALPPALKGIGAAAKYVTRPATEVFKDTFKKAFPTMARDIKGNIENKISSGFNVVKDIIENNKTIGLIDEATGEVRTPNTYSYADVNEIFNKRMPQIYKDYTASLSQVDKEKFSNTIGNAIKTKLDELANSLSKENVESKQKALSQKIREIQNLRDTTPEGIQNYIEGLNQEAKWVPGTALTTKQIQAANIAGDFRKILDDSIDKVGDIGGYQEARNLYGSYRQLKDQLAVLAARELRSTPGLVDRLTNMGLTAEGIHSLITANPKGLLLAAGVKVGSKLWKKFGSPERSLNKLFDLVGKETIELNQKSLKKAANIQPSKTANINAPINNIDNTILQKTVSAIDDVENLQWLEEVSKQGPSEKVFIPKGLIQEKIDELTEEIGKRRMSKEFNVQALENLKNSFAGGGFDFATYARMRNAGVRDIESLNKSGLGKSGQSVLRQLEDYAGDKDISEMMSQADDILDLIKTAKGPVGTKELISERARLISEEMYENAKKNFKENMGRINSGIPVDQIKDLTVMAAYHIERGVRSAAELAKVYAEAGYNFTKKELESLYNKAIKEKPTIVSGSKLPLNKIEELEQFKGFFDADTQKFSSPEIKKDAIKFLVDNDIDIKSTKDADIVDHIDEILTRRESLRKVTAGEVKGVSKELQPLVETLDTLNPTGSIFAEYTPAMRAKMPLGKNITTYDKTAGLDANEIITIYRGTGKGNSIVAGDFVTTNKQLAKDYAGNGKVLEAKVKASDVLDDVTEPLGEEYIYRPKNKANGKK